MYILFTSMGISKLKLEFYFWYMLQLYNYIRAKRQAFKFTFSFPIFHLSHFLFELIISVYVQNITM